MPGTIPATSQLDRLISMTAINVLAGSRAMRDRFKLFNVCMGSSIGSQRTMDAISTPPPHSIFHHGDSKTRWNNLSGGLAVNMTAGPSGQTISPHPSSREGHHSTAGGARSPPIAFDPARLSSHWKLPGPPELRAVNPHAMHDHGQPTCERHDRLLHPAVPGDLHRPSLEPGPLRRTHQHALGRLVEHDPHHLISAPRYCTGSVVLARLILGGCESKHRPHRFGLSEAGRYIDGDAIGQCDHRANAGDRHEAPAYVIVPDDGQQAAMQDAELLANDLPDNEQRFHQHGQIGN